VALPFTFTNGAYLAPGAFFVIAPNAALAVKYPGVAVNGVYTGKLSNGGDRLTLSDPIGANVFSFTYGAQPPWPITPGGYGFSLVLSNPSGDPASPLSWRASANIGGVTRRRRSARQHPSAGHQ